MRTNRRSARGPDVFEVQFSLDDFTTSVLIGAYSIVDTANYRQVFDLTGFSELQWLDQFATFRIFGFDATLNVGTYRLGIDVGEAGSGLPANLVVSGMVIPEPSSLAMTGLPALLGLALGWQRYRRLRAMA